MSKERTGRARGGKWSGTGLASHVRTGIEAEANRQDAFNDVKWACHEYLMNNSRSYRRMRSFTFGKRLGESQ